MNSRPSSAMGERYRLCRLRHKALSEVLSCYLPSVEMIQCQWCHAQNQPGTTSCQMCGAPLDMKDKVSDSGWREAPRLRDMTEFPFSRNAPGELVVLPLHPGMELDVREHAFLVASHSVQYSFIRIKGLVNLLHGGNGMYIDRFVTAGYPGMLVLHGNGDVLERMLRPGEKILVEPGGFLYKDATVQMQATQMPVKIGLMRHIY